MPITTNLGMLKSKDFGMFYRPLSYILGLNAAVFLQELIDRCDLIYDKEDGPELSYDNLWFYHTVDNIQDRIFLGKDAQQGAIKVLIQNDLIEIKLSGIPCKRHFCIKESKILPFLLDSIKKYASRKKNDTDDKENKINFASLREPANYHAGTRKLSYKKEKDYGLQ